MRKVLLISVVIILVAAGGWYFYAKSKQDASGYPKVTDFGSFFPIGANKDPNIPGSVPIVGGSDSESTTPQATSPFKQLSPHPIAGFVAYTATVSTTTPADPKVPKSKPTTQTTTKQVLRYVSRGNGYVYEIADDAIPLQVSNISIPNIYDAIFVDKYATALLRFLRDDQRTIATYSVPVPPANPDGTRTQKQGLYFPDNINQMVVSPDGTQVARLTTDTAGALLSITTSTNTKKVDYLRTPFREWILSWPNPKSLYLQTKASAQVPGYLYRIDTTEKKLRRVLGDINGLTASVSPSGTYVLYSQNSGTSFVTKLLNTKTNTTQSLSLRILPEKCAWLANEDLVCAGNTFIADAAYPDAWYQGITSFSDQLYHIYTGSAIYDTLYDGTERSFDMTNISVSEITRRVYFIDKPTGLLWQFSY